MARPERFELPTYSSGGCRSIQLSYGRVLFSLHPHSGIIKCQTKLNWISSSKEVGKMKIGSIVVHCYEFDEMLCFWQKALHYVPREPAKDGWVVLRDPEGRGPNLSLNQVQEKRSGRRSRLHLDLYTNKSESEVERLIAIGATRYPWRHKPGSDFVVLQDPDDNLFCVVQVFEPKLQPDRKQSAPHEPSGSTPHSL